MPHVVELDGEQSAVLERSLETLREGGLEIEPFGERDVSHHGDAGRIRRAALRRGRILDDLTADPKRRDVRERVWASLACHSVTIAGERLESDEMTTLIDRLQQLPQSDALPARPSDDGAARTGGHRAHVQACLSSPAF